MTDAEWREALAAARDPARRAVDRAIRRILDPVPCFCTPQRPELERPPYCTKHVILGRPDRDALTAEVQQTLDAPS